MQLPCVCVSCAVCRPTDAVENDWGYTDWGRHIPSLLMNSQSYATEAALEMMLGDRYCRTNVQLPAAIAIDDAASIPKVRVLPTTTLGVCPGVDVATRSSGPADSVSRLLLLVGRPPVQLIEIAEGIDLAVTKDFIQRKFGCAAPSSAAPLRTPSSARLAVAH